MEINLSEVKLLLISNANSISDIEDAIGDILSEEDLEQTKKYLFEYYKSKMVFLSDFKKDYSKRILLGLKDLIDDNKLKNNEKKVFSTVNFDKIILETPKIEKGIGKENYTRILNTINDEHPVVRDKVKNMTIKDYQIDGVVEIEISKMDIVLENGYLDLNKVKDVLSKLKSKNIIYHLTADSLEKEQKQKVFLLQDSYKEISVDDMLGIEKIPIIKKTKLEEKQKKKKKDKKRKSKKNGFLDIKSILFLILFAYTLTIGIIFMLN